EVSAHPAEATAAPPVVEPPPPPPDSEKTFDGEPPHFDGEATLQSEPPAETVPFGTAGHLGEPSYDHLPPAERPTQLALPTITNEDIARVEQQEELAARPSRRGQAPLFAGRAQKVSPIPSTPLEPLPRTPPPNATAWTSFPSSSPPPPSLLSRPLVS